MFNWKFSARKHGCCMLSCVCFRGDVPGMVREEEDLRVCSQVSYLLLSLKLVSRHGFRHECAKMNRCGF